MSDTSKLVPLNWFERGLAVVSPAAAARRVQARVVLGEIRRYEAAAVNRHTANWNATGASVNEEVSSSLDRVRNRARDMVRNNEWANSAVRHMVTSLVGAGIVVSPDLDSERQRWRTWYHSTDADPDGRHTVSGIWRLAVRTWKESGEVLIRRRWRRVSDNLSIPLQLQVLEPDHIDSLKNEVTATGFILLGVEYNLLGQRIAYWLFQNHPGESRIMGTRHESVRVPAADVIHLMEVERPSQVRGMSALGVALMRTRKTSDYEFALALRKQVESCFSAFVHTDDESMRVGGAPLDPSDTGRPRREKLAAGLIQYLKGGESVEFANPQVSAGEDTFLTYQLRAMAAGWGLPYELMTGDLSKANFSSNRMGWFSHLQYVEEQQVQILVPQLINPTRRWFQEALLSIGEPVGDKPDAITMPRVPWIKPSEDVAALKESERAGYTTKGEALRAQGWASVEEFAEERARELEVFKKYGLSFDTDAAKPAKTPAASDEKTAKNDDDDADDKTADGKPAETDKE